MNFIQRVKFVSPIMRIMIGFILIYSGYIKIVEPFEYFYSAIISYKVVGEGLAYIIALILPWFEVYLGVFVMFGLFEKYVLIICGILFIVFEILLLQAIVRGLDVINCGCFGSRHSNPIGVEFMLNIIWLCFIFISYRFSSNFSLDVLIEKKFRDE